MDGCCDIRWLMFYWGSKEATQTGLNISTGHQKMPGKKIELRPTKLQHIVADVRRESKVFL